MRRPAPETPPRARGSLTTGKATPARPRALEGQPGPSNGGIDLVGFLTEPLRRPPSRGRRLGSYDLALREAERRARDGDWSGCNGRALVGLYAHCHRLVYRVPADDLQAEAAMTTASRRASKLMREHAGGNGELMARFVKWTWEREQNRRHRSMRIGWRLQFSPGLFTEFRVVVAGDRRV